MAATLVLLRHGQSEWNRQNIFTGWVDVPLSDLGKEEAFFAKKALKDFEFDAVFTSALKRARDTAKIVLEGRMPKVCVVNEALNERHYGKLQGKNKDDMRAQYGPEMVHVWRRSYQMAPPGGESLNDTFNRVLPYFKKNIEPLLREGKNVLISAHGNSLRALIKYLENLSDDEIVAVEIPTGKPIVYKLNNDLMVLEKTMARV